MSHVKPGVVNVQDLIHYAPSVLGAKMKVTVGVHIYVGFFMGVHYNGSYHKIYLQGITEGVPVDGRDQIEILS